MKVINQVHPIPAQAQAFCNDPDDSPFVMINLLNFKDQAEYPDGSDAQLSGREPICAMAWLCARISSAWAASRFSDRTGLTR